MNARIIAMSIAPEPERFWTNIGPKTFEEILADLLLGEKSRIRFWQLSEVLKERINIEWDKRLEEKIIADVAMKEAAMKKEKINRWRANKDLAKKFIKRR